MASATAVAHLCTWLTFESGYLPRAGLSPLTREIDRSPGPEGPGRAGKGREGPGRASSVVREMKIQKLLHGSGYR